MGVRPAKRWMWTAAILLPAVGGFVRAQNHAPDSEEQSPLQPYRVVVGFRTSVSGGDMSLDKLAREARTAGIDGVMLSDRLSRQLQYGLPPLRYLLWFALRKPSVSTMGPARYIENVRTLNRAQKDVCLVPGVRVTPAYYWTGSLLGDLQCHNYHREILMLGARASGPLVRLPYAAGYVPGRDGPWIFASRFLLLFCVALWVGYYYVPAWVRHRFRIRRRKTKSVYFVFLIVPSLVILAFFNLVTGGVRRFHVHGPPEGMGPEQEVLNQGAEAGFFQVWSHPQAGVEAYRWPVSFVTPPYREVITLTHNFNAFSCFSISGEDLYAPGQVWDRLLLDYIEQVAPYPVWTVGDLLDPNKLVGTPGGMVDNVVFARAKTPEAFLAALEAGRFYSRRRSPTNAIDFKSFTVEGHSFGERAKTDRSRMKVAFEVSSIEPGTQVEVKLIRNGVVLYSFKGVTPFTKELSDSIDQRTENVYYRITAEGPGRLAAVGQPVFLTYAPPDRPWGD